MMVKTITEPLQATSLTVSINVSPDMKLLTIHLVAVTPEHATADTYIKTWQMLSLWLMVNPLTIASTHSIL